MKYYILKIHLITEPEVFSCEVNKRTLDYLLGPWQEENKPYRHDNGDESGFLIYKECISAFSWDEIFKECNIGLQLIKE